jgi:hypothetical protein
MRRVIRLGGLVAAAALSSVAGYQVGQQPGGRGQQGPLEKQIPAARP